MEVNFTHVFELDTVYEFAFCYPWSYTENIKLIEFL
jgi:hypothetical protein